MLTRCLAHRAGLGRTASPASPFQSRGHRRLTRHLEMHQREHTRRLLCVGSRQNTPEVPQSQPQPQPPSQSQAPDRHGKQPASSNAAQQPRQPDHLPDRQGMQPASPATAQQPQSQVPQQSHLQRGPGMQPLRAGSPAESADEHGPAGSTSVEPSRASTDSSAADRLPEGPVVQAPAWPPATGTLSSPGRHAPTWTSLPLTFAGQTLQMLQTIRWDPPAAPVRAQRGSS